LLLFQDVAVFVIAAKSNAAFGKSGTRNPHIPNAQVLQPASKKINYHIHKTISPVK
jgi:hypothetical protein